MASLTDRASFCRAIWNAAAATAEERAAVAGYRMVAKGKEGEIYLYGDVGASFFGGVDAKTFADDLKALGKVDTLHVRINSFGGDVFDGLAIYRQLVDHPAKVISHVDGIAGSIASVITMAGAEIEIAESGFLMIHDASGLTIGTADDMRQMAETLETVTSTLADVYVARTKNPVAKVRDWMTAETWFTGQAAVDAGFADTIAANMRLAARLDPAKHPYKHPPAALVGTPNLEAARERMARMRATLDARRLKELRAA